MPKRSYRFVGADADSDKPWETTRTSEEFDRDLRKVRGEDKPKPKIDKVKRPESGTAEDIERRNKIITKHVGGKSKSFKKNQNEDDED